MRITKDAKTDFEKALREHFEANADERLAAKINEGRKTFAGCASHLTEWARQKSTNGVAIISDAEVFGEAAHFFEEDDIKEPAKKAPQAKVTQSKPAARPEEKTEPEQRPAPLAKPAPRPLPKGAVAGQLDIFGLLGGTP